MSGVKWGGEEKGTGGEEKRGMEERKRVGMGSSREREGRAVINSLIYFFVPFCMYPYIY